MANLGGFSWRRLIGITRAKSSVSRMTGIPWTRSGRQRKVGKIVTGGGCLLPIFVLLVVAVAVVVAGAGVSVVLSL